MKKPIIKKPDKIPKGWFCRAQLEKKWKLSTSQTRNLITEAVKLHLYERKNFKVLCTRGVMAVPHYREKK
jgi:hypothetical protein